MNSMDVPPKVHSVGMTKVRVRCDVTSAVTACTVCGGCCVVCCTLASLAWRRLFTHFMHASCVAGLVMNEGHCLYSEYCFGNRQRFERS